MNVQEAIKILREAVGESHLEGQPYINLSLVPAQKRPECQKALATVQAAVAKGEISHEDLLSQLAL